MLALEDVTYSRSACIDAIRGCYRFLATLDLDDALVSEPPDSGWPSITPSVLKDLDKTNEVVALLRHLPYLDNQAEPKCAPKCKFANWESNCTAIERGHTSAEGLEITTEDPEIRDYVPSHVIGLTQGGRGTPTFLLDTTHGSISWYECPLEISAPAFHNTIDDDPYEYASTEAEAEWLMESSTWAIEDFFDVLKDQFRSLNFVPLSKTGVVDVWTTFGPGSEGMVERVRGVL
ncbi:hypothetical protein N0V83_001620 [Neocucurbitaria cava]|uniref:Uncharacterized protein n=1 Tax=Neocucurbitaria cava TaxID=798079 RepID=A0A9W8YFY4_9PLEO|nr:hypothetical protein N0V83_001620 [Neocucurbitaria cava]